MNRKPFALGTTAAEFRLEVPARPEIVNAPRRTAAAG